MALGGPIPDKSFPVLVYNMERADEFVNSDALVFVDRFDKNRKTITALILEAQAAYRLASDAPQGNYGVGVVYEESNWTYFYNNEYWGLSDAFDLSQLPYTATEADPNNDTANLMVRSNASQSYVQSEDLKVEGRIVGGRVYSGSGVDGSVNNGDVIPYPSSRFRVLVGSDVLICEAWSGSGLQIVSGYISNLDATNLSATVGGVDVALRLTNYNLNDPRGWGVGHVGISRCFTYTNSVKLESDILCENIVVVEESGKTFDRNGHDLIWTGATNLANSGRDFGIITFKGTYGTTPVATATSDLLVGSNSLTVNSTSGLVDGGFAYITFVKSGDKTTDLLYDLRLLVKVHVVDSTTIEIDYKSGYNISAADIEIYSADPIVDCHVVDFSLDDQQVVTPSTSISSVPPLVERQTAVCGVVFDTCADCTLDKAVTKNAKWPVVLHRRTNNVNSVGVTVNKPVWWGAGAGYGIQVNDGLNCSVEAKGLLSRHAVDFTGSAYCEAINSGDWVARNGALLCHGRSEHDINFVGCFGDASIGRAGTSIYGDLTYNINFSRCKLSELKANSLSFSLTDNTYVDLLEFKSYSYEQSSSSKVRNANIMNLEDRVNTIIDFDTKILVDDSSTFSFVSSPKTINGFDDVILSGAMKGNGSIVSRVDVYNCKKLKINGKLTDVQFEFRQSHELIDLSGVSSNYTISENGKVFQSRDLRASNDTVVINATNMQLSGGPATLPGDRLGYFFNGVGQTVPCNVAIVTGNNSLVDFDSASRINSAASFTITQYIEYNEIYVNCPASVRSGV